MVPFSLQEIVEKSILVEAFNTLIMAATLGKPTIKIDEEIKQHLDTEEQRTTIVHCRIYSPFPTLARVWKTTFLVEEEGRKVSLIKAFNISMAPDWTWFVSNHGFINFTLLFEGLSKGCTLFQLLEIIDEPGGFFSEKITRNKTDVYQTELSFLD